MAPLKTCAAQCASQALLICPPPSRFRSAQGSAGIAWPSSRMVGVFVSHRNTRPPRCGKAASASDGPGRQFEDPPASRLTGARFHL